MSAAGERSLRDRFRAVALVGVVCAGLLGLVVVGLTGSAPLGAAVAVAVAVVLVGLGVVGVRNGEAQPAALAAHEARQRRLRAALGDEVAPPTRPVPAPAPDEPGETPGPGPTG